MAIENFTTYTEVDASGVITVTSTRCTALNCDRDIEAYVYKDFGAAYFDALDIYVTIYIDTNTQNAGTQVFGLADNIEDASNWDALSFGIQHGKTTPGTPRMSMQQGVSGGDYYDGSTNTPYYLHIERDAGNDTITCKIYDDAGRTNLVDTLTRSGYSTETWRYAYAIASYNDGNTGRDYDGYVENLDFSPGAVGIAASKRMSAMT